MEQNVAIIDADSLVWIAAYHHKDHDLLEASLVKNAFDDIMKAILLYTKATHYGAAFSCPSDMNIRNGIYKFAKYKGNRPPKPEFMVKWEGILKEHAIKTWGIISLTHFEADDIVFTLQQELTKKNILCVVCSQDKDLRQAEGYYYNYKKLENPIEFVDKYQALMNFYTQLLMGDTADNVKGLPKIGIKKAQEILKDCDQWPEFFSTVKGKYDEYFGEYYGPIIFKETFDTLQLYKVPASEVINFEPIPIPAVEGIDIEALKTLGWV